MVHDRGGMNALKEDMKMNTQNIIDIYEEFEAESVSF
ncbi:MAG: hypothetical protein JWN14_3196 [Chthonomonadales bacterium]|nr:hypothetical protein [Chthonomonadales bacterium]